MGQRRQEFHMLLWEETTTGQQEDAVTVQHREKLITALKLYASNTL